MLKNYNDKVLMKICILGTGQMAMAICKLLENKLEEVYIYGRDLEQLKELCLEKKNSKYFDYKFNLSFQTNKLENFKHTIHMFDLIFYCLPVNCLNDLYLTPNTNMIYTCKGFKNDYIYNQTKNYGLLFGPSYSSEIMNNEYTCLTFSSDNKNMINNMRILFEKHLTCKIYYTNNLKDVELLGIYKNIIAIFSGVIDELGLGKNTSSAFMIKLLHSINLNFSELCQPAGIGDIFLTCSSSKSRNYIFGKKLIRYNKINSDILSEGYTSILNIKDNLFVNKLLYFINNLETMTVNEKIKYIIQIIDE